MTTLSLSFTGGVRVRARVRIRVRPNPPFHLATPGSKTSLEFEVFIICRSILSEGLLALKWASIVESPHTDNLAFMQSEFMKLRP